MPRASYATVPLPELPHRPHWTPEEGKPKGAAKYGNRPGDTELAARYELVSELIIRGYRRTEVMRYVAESTDWDISERTVDAYMERSRDLIGNAPRESIRQSTEKVLSRLDFLYRRCVAKGDERTALRVTREYAQFRGLGRMNRARLAAMAAGTEPPDTGDEVFTPPTDVARAAVVSELLAVAKRRAVASGAVTLAVGSDGDN